VTTTSLADRLFQRAFYTSINLTLLELSRLGEYYTLLERWNKKINLTSLSLRGFPDETIDRLLIEPLTASRVVPDVPMTWFDVGSGGGSPAIPLKVVRPAARLTMVEARSRKAAFLREAVRALELAETTVRTIRVEQIEAETAAHLADLVTVRAVRVDASLVKACNALLKPGGRLLLFASADRRPDEPRGFRAGEVVQLSSSGSTLYTFSKLG
jgi:16S rRNA (guanine527-N7)-methyltransferase